MLSLKNIVKDYITGNDKVHALKGIDIEFRENEFVSILGPSGCGKTTLLNIIGGLDRYTSGDLIINGKSTKEFKNSDWDTYRNHSIGFVFQNYNLIPHQTVLSNVELALTLSGVSKTERRQRAIDVLKQVGLGDQIHKKPNQMSGGQMQRVAIARALINDPDILLADEPTGALDSVTSVQIMEILKKISKDKLIIMVTHNPELADKYSTRVIKLLDGKVTDDSNPYSSSDKKSDKKKAEADRKKGKKTSMSLLTALSLSMNNLLTKKARTFLTSFAGSIGIIGIALILSLSNGVQVYIDDVQKDTLSTFPLQIVETSTDLSKIMQAFAESKEEEISHPTDDNKIYSNNRMSDLINKMLSDVTHNNMKAFKNYLEENSDEFEKYTSDIQYGYSTPLNIYRIDSNNQYIQVSPSQIFKEMGFSNELTEMNPNMNTGNVWAEMISNNDILNAQYDVVAGHMPENADEVVIVINKYNEIDDFTLYTLGLKDQNKLRDIFSSVMKGETFVNESTEYTYNDILNLKFKLILNTDFYQKVDNSWVDKKDDTEYMSDIINNGMDIKVVGIIKPNEDASAASIGGTIGYKHELMEMLINKVNGTEIVKQQLDDPETDVFTGMKFKMDETSQEIQNNDAMASAFMGLMNMQNLSDFASADNSEMSEEQSAAMAEMTDEEKAAYLQQNIQLPSRDEILENIDTSKLSEEQLDALQNMSDEELISYIMSMKDKYSESKVTKKVETTFEQNKNLLGISDIDNPTSINIFPKDFESKEHITDLINEYNEKAEKDGNENDIIEYTDIVGTMISSVSSIIKAISYVLIAFVAISLIVSSIMIGIITYISVLERTKEIGILRSIGASKRDISRVFNAETLIVGFTSGTLGIGISYLLTIPINMIIAHVTTVPVRASIPIIAGFILIGISMFLTFIAGLIPSRIAAKKDPVIALRSE